MSANIYKMCIPDDKESIENQLNIRIYSSSILFDS